MNGVSIFSIDQAKLTNLAIVGTACFVCSKIPKELLRCKDCLRLSYCSDACQKADSDSHKKICLGLKRAPESTPSYSRRRLLEKGLTPYDLEPRVGTLHMSQVETFKRLILPEAMTVAHADLFFYEPRCAVCLHSADDMRTMIDPKCKALLYCPDCRAAFACTEAHAAEYRNEHCRKLEEGERFTECQMNQRAYANTLEIVNRGWTVTETLWFPKRRKDEYAPLPTDTSSAWSQWFADPTNLCPPGSSPALNRVRTKQLSIPMTVLYGMQCFDKALGDSPQLPHLCSRTELDIAVLGAMEYELQFGGLACWEEILHSLPSVRRLTVRFIGPEVNEGLVKSGVENEETLRWEVCALCKEKGIEFHRSFHQATFHDYIKDHENHTLPLSAEKVALAGTAFVWPDMVVMFNTGMGLKEKALNPKWSPTIEALAENGVPTLCTSFCSREAEEDEQFLKLYHCDIVIGRHKNPWRSAVVTKMLTSRKGFFSYNGFVQGFRGRAERDDSDLVSTPQLDVEFEKESQRFQALIAFRAALQHDAETFLRDLERL